MSILIGPRTHGSGKTGGVTTSFELLCSTLAAQGHDCVIIDSNFANYKTPIHAICAMVVQLARHLRRASHVSLHGTARDFIYLAPIVVLACRRLRVKVSLRKFAGNFDMIVNELGAIRRAFVFFALRRADSCFFETQYLVKQFRRHNESTYWLPNCRKIQPSRSNARTRHFQNRFVFLGQVCKEKGIAQILAASLELHGSYSIDIYGSIDHKKYLSIDWRKYPRVTYRGKVAPEEVSDLLREYDVLLLPSYWSGEGYPGVVIEAFGAGVPVIASSLRGIREMLTDGVEGILIQPRSTSALLHAMNDIGTRSIEAMGLAARRRAEAFEVGSVVREFVRRARIA